MPAGQLTAPRRASLSVAKMENTLLAAETGGFELEIIHSQTKRLVQRSWVKYLVRTCSLLSLVSVCANTPKTYQLFPSTDTGFGLRELLFAIDALVALVLTAEMTAKWRMKGVFRGESSYFKSRWCRFDFSMTLCLYASLIVHVFEISNRLDAYSFWSVVRAPRPLILVRLLRSALKFRLPRSRIQAILQRSSQQVFSVTIFLLFFMSLYGLLGVQFFGEMTHHCVRRGVNRSAVTKADLAIPDTYCSPTANRQRARPVTSNASESDASATPTPYDLASLLTTSAPLGGSLDNVLGIIEQHGEESDKEGHSCPQNMECVALDKDKHGFAGFDDFLISFFTVYQAASQEGWVFNMYRAMDSLQSWKALVYFISLIFFLAWLVKNVFIAVLIETFAEIRVQFQQMWVTPRAVTLDDSHKLTLALDADARWRLVQLDASRPEGVAPAWAQRAVRSSAFHVSVYLLLVANAVTAASRTFDPLASPSDSSDWWTDGWYLAEIAYTALFDLETLFKVWCLGRAAYWKRTLHRFETILCVFTTLHCVWPLYRSYLTYFQVLRIVRLIKASPMLEDFCFKIFGPVKKLGSLVIFTLCLLIITSTISLQLFCCIADLEKFATFPTAFRSMFQILTQKGWIDVMSDSMDKAMGFAQPLVPLVAIYFVFYHLFVTLIVLSLFVAVILDNLELDEDLKKLKQLKMREMSAETQQKLPLRLRIFEKFPNRPQMIRLNRVPSDFNVPKVRESFFRQFVNQGYDPLSSLTQVAGGVVGMANSGQPNHVMAVGADSLRQKAAAGTTRHSIVAMRSRSFALGQRGRRMREDTQTNAAGTLSNHTGARENHVSTVSTTRDPKHIVIKMSALNDILRECNLQRLFVNNPQQLQRDQWHQGSVSGSKSLLSQQHRIRLDRRMHNTESAANSESDKDGASKSSGAKSSSANATSDAAHEFDISLIQQKAKQAEMARTQLEEDLRENHPYFDTPLFTVGRDSRIRKLCLTIVNARYTPPEVGNQKYKRFQKLLGSVTYLDWFMIIVTLFSIISMLCETPQLRVASFLEATNQTYYEKYSLRLTFIFVMEYVFVTCMTLEMMFKIFANGLIFTPNALLKDAGGFLSLFTYIVAIVFAIWIPSKVSQMSPAHILMLFRCLRPLRFFCLVPQMRQVVYELLRGFREILMVSVLLVVYMFMFASFGVQNFGGRLARCNDGERRNFRENCTGLFRRKIFVTKLKLGTNDEAPSFLVHRVWANPKNFNFDNIGNAMLALFEVLSLEGWIEVREILEDRIGPLHAIVYIHVFVFIGCMIGLTLFVGVVITNYSQNRGTSLLTVDQRRWLDLKARIKLTQPLHTPPRPDQQIWRAKIYDFVQSQKCKRFVGWLILANSLLLVVPWYDSERNDPTAPDPALTRHLAYASVAFNLIFFAEAVLKIIALNFNGYFQSLRNRFDFVISVSGMLFNVLLLFARNKATYTVGWCVIVVRFFTITGKYARLKMLLLTVLTSMLKSFFIILSMIVLMLCYAFNGVLLFGSVKYGENLGRHAHFKSAPQAIALLCRIVTGEDWNKIAHDCMIQPPFCTVKDNFWETNCGNFYAATLYFCSYYIIITYIMLNLLVAIIMENFTLFYSSDEDVLLSYNDIRQFQQSWDIVDINRKGSVPIRRVKILLLILKGRLEVDIERDKWLFKHMYFELEKVHNGGDVSYHDVLYMLSYRSVDIRKSLQFDELMQREQLEFMIEEEVAKQTIRIWLDKCLKRRRKMHEKSNMYASLRAQSSDLVVTVTEIASLNNPFQMSTSGAISPQGHTPAGGLSTNFVGESLNADQKNEISRGLLNGMTPIMSDGNDERSVSFNAPGGTQLQRDRERDASPSASSTCSVSQQDSGSALQSAGMSTKDVEFSYPSVPSLPTTTSGSCSTLTPARSGITGNSSGCDEQDTQATQLADNLAASRIARRRIERNTSLPVMLSSTTKTGNDSALRDADGGANSTTANSIPEENFDGLVPASGSFSESRSSGTFKRRSQKAGATVLPGLHESETELLGKDGSSLSDGSTRPGDGRTSNNVGDSGRPPHDDEAYVTPKPKSGSLANDEAGRPTLAPLNFNKEDNVSDHGSFSNEIQSQCLFMSAEKTQTAFVAAQHVKTWWSQLLGSTPNSSPIASRGDQHATHKYSYDRVKQRGRAVRMATCDSDSDSNP